MFLHLPLQYLDNNLLLAQTSLLRSSRYLGRRTLLPTNGCSHPNHILFYISANHNVNSIYRNWLVPKYTNNRLCLIVIVASETSNARQYPTF